MAARASETKKIALLPCKYPGGWGHLQTFELVLIDWRQQQADQCRNVRFWWLEGDIIPAPAACFATVEAANGSEKGVSVALMRKMRLVNTGINRLLKKIWSRMLLLGWSRHL